VEAGAVAEIADPGTRSPIRGYKLAFWRHRYENVSFSYVAGLPALTHVSFHVPPGTIVGLVGATGAGSILFSHEALSISIDPYKMESTRVCALPLASSSRSMIHGVFHL